MEKGRYRGLGVLMALLSCAGCKSWQPTTASPMDVITSQRPPAVRITNAAGASVTVRSPVIRNDSIVTSETNALGNPLQGPGVRYSDVNTLEVERFNPVKTGLFVAALAAAGITWAQVSAGDSSGGNNDPDPPLPKGLTVSVGSVLGFLSAAFR